MFGKRKMKYMKFCPICGQFHEADKEQSFKDVCHIYKQWQKKYYSADYYTFEVGDLITPTKDKVNSYLNVFEDDILIIESINKKQNTITAKILTTKQKNFGNIINNLSLDELKPKDFVIVPENLMEEYYGGMKDE